MKVISVLFIVYVAVVAMAFTGCASSHQKKVGFGFGLYQAEYYDDVEVKK